MAHTHNITDSDQCFVIDPITRSITSNSDKVKLIQRDHNSERFTFACPRFIEDHDMLLCDSILVQYANIDKKTKEESCDVYSVKDVKLGTDKNMIEFSWLISETATAYVGPLRFLIEFMCFGEDNNTVYSWHTEIFKGITVAAGMNNKQAIVEKYPDVLTQLEDKINSIGDLKEYAKKTEIPKIPTNVSTFENDAGYLTEHQNLEEYAKKSEIPDVPTKTSQLENDSGFLTEHQNLEEYAKKTEIPAIPTVTVDDNGKILRVVDGVWAAITISDANGVSF